MITYSYRCYCGYEFDTKQSIHDKSLIRCPVCDTDGLERVICGGTAAFVTQDAKTVGQQSSRNTKTLGTYHKQAIQHQLQEQQDKITAEKELATGVKPLNKQSQDLLTKISKMTPEQKTKYILEG